MADTDLLSEGSRERRVDDKTQADLVARWLSEIELSEKAEKDWRADADKARKIFRAEAEKDGLRFNILYSNVQTEVPSLYNSTPTPDVRTRYHDEQEVSRLTSQAIERVLSYSVDAYDFDGNVKAGVQDRQLAGRGAVRARYKPYAHNKNLYQEVTCEHVPWKSLRLGPATCWEEMPWIAFEHFLTRDQLERLSPEVGGSINLDTAIDSGDKVKIDAAPNVYKRARTWEIWDRLSRKVIWIAPSFKVRPIREDDDPLGLSGFFPMPDPMYAIRTAGTMVPTCPYRVIAPLVDELEEITERIQGLVRVIRWRGFRHPALPSFERLADAVDGELLDASEDVMSLVQGGGLDKFVWLMPIDQAIKTVQALYVQREQIKQTIFEVSGLSDILRGQTNPNETLGAQEIKANYGSLRLQDGQKDVQRFCRDLFRIKAEIVCNLFTSQNIRLMTGLNQPSRQAVDMAKAKLRQLSMAPAMGHNGGPPMQAQQPPEDVVELSKQVPWEDILEVLKSGATRSYRIDIESDSTIRGEVRTQQESASTFLDGTAKFMEAMGPAVQSGMMTPDVAVDLYSAFARLFRLGKQAEDALSRMGQKAQEMAKNPAPPLPDPEMLKLEAENKRAEAKLAQDAKAADQDAQLKAQQAQQAQMLKEAEFKHSASLKEMEFKHNAAMEAFKIESQHALSAQDLQHQIAVKQADHELAREQKQKDYEMSREQMLQQSALKRDEFAHTSALRDREFEAEARREDGRQNVEITKATGRTREQTAALDQKMAQIAESLMAGAAQQQALAQSISQVVGAIAEQAQQSARAQETLTKALTAPKEVVRDPKTGRAVGVVSRVH